MFDKPNLVRAKLDAGKPVVGVAIHSWSPPIVDVAAIVGLDFVRVETEHAWRRDDLIEHMTRGAWAGGTTPFVRVDRGDFHAVRKAMEIGMGGVLMSAIESAEEARMVVKAARFPPLGDRGFSGNNFSGGWAQHPADRWIAWSNREPLVGVLIENPQAYGELDRILAIEGLDIVFFGSGDYSIAIGLPKPDKNHPEIRKIFEDTTRRTRAAGKYAMATGIAADDVQAMIALGINVVELGSDVSLVAAAFKKGLAAARG